jgi:predicted aldo/keto reductase-like oxidoreductase
MRYYYYSQSLKEKKSASRYYRELEGPKAEACKGCSGNCEKACPYNVAIRELIKDADRNLC